ncbi:MAG TPA: type II toxin-antitoxin system VapC family toxin [Terriglobales bacterium]|nr:type II toxin-antitoxin system VapC family toxin [Terriglobales bacterium]
MSLYYLETSALVKLYVRESGTEALLELTASADHQFAVLTLSAVEMRSALRRRERAGDIDRNASDLILDRFLRHSQNFFIQQPTGDALLPEAASLIDRYALRALDALQLAGCSLMARSGGAAPVFTSADSELLDAASAEGFAVLNPSVQA